MKITRLLAASLAAAALFLASCDNDKSKGGDSGKTTGGAVSEQEALDAFKKAAAEIEALIKEGKATADPAAGISSMKAAFAKMESIKTEGLPADLKESFIAARSSMAELMTMFKGMPEKPEEAMAWMQKTMTDPAVAQKMQTIGEANKAKSEKFKEVAAKYGIKIDTD